MKRLIIYAALSVGACLSASAQESTFQDPLLDHLVGKWVLQGTIAGQKTTHDVRTAWVLGHEYLRLNEVAREKDARGRPAYEAIVLIGWDKAAAEYVCLWLDTTSGGGLAAQTLGRAKRGGDEIAFLFTSADGSLFRTTFAYSRSADSWQWLMDSEEGGKRQPFARVKLSRKQTSR